MSRLALVFFVVFFAAINVGAGSNVAPRYGELPKENCLASDWAAQMAVHCFSGVSVPNDLCCEAVAASLNTGHIGRDDVPCICFIEDEMVQYAAWFDINDVVNMYVVTCKGRISRKQIDDTVALCTG